MRKLVPSLTGHRPYRIIDMANVGSFSIKLPVGWLTSQLVIGYWEGWELCLTLVLQKSSQAL